MEKTKFIDPICGMTVDPAKAAGSYQHEGETYYFCSKGCLQKFIAQTEGRPETSAPAGKLSRRYTAEVTACVASSR